MSDCGCQGRAPVAVAQAGGEPGCGCKPARSGATPLRPSRGSPKQNLPLHGGPQHWCGTDAPDRGFLPAAAQVPASKLLPQFGWHLTPFGAVPLVPGQPNTLDWFSVVEQYRQRARSGPTGRLVPNPATCLRPEAQTALLPGRRVRGERAPAAAKVAPAAWWASLPPAFRAMAQGMGVRPPAAPQPAGGPVPLLAYVLPADDPALAPTAAELPDWLTDPRGCEGTYECALAEKVVIDYAGSRLCLPMDWFVARVDADDWLSESEALSTLWSTPRSHGTGLNVGQAKALLDCWMIEPSRDRTGRTYSMFFDGGHAPINYFYLALDLVRRNVDLIKDHWSGNTLAARFDEWVANALDGKEVGNYDNENRCTLTMRVRSHHSFLGDRSVENTCLENQPDTNCNGTPKFAPGSFDCWSASLTRLPTADATPIYMLVVPTEKNAFERQPTTGTGVLGYAPPKQFAVNLPANVVAFRAYALDFSLFWARTALQYCYEEADIPAMASAVVYARAAQVRVVSQLGTIVHELGHLQFGVGGHCIRGDGDDDRRSPQCYFDIAASHFSCGIRARLGLPDGEYYSCTTPTRDAGYDNCGDEIDDEAGDEQISSYYRVCDPESHCKVNASFTFEATSCTLS